MLFPSTIDSNDLTLSTRSCSFQRSLENAYVHVDAENIALSLVGNARRDSNANLLARAWCTLTSVRDCRCSLYRRYFWMLHQRHAMLLQCETTELLRKMTHASPPSSTVLSRRESDMYMRCVVSQLYATTISLYCDSLRHQGRTKRGKTPTRTNVTIDLYIELHLRMQRTLAQWFPINKLKTLFLRSDFII